ncbi:MAG: LPXTG cell wall anchor domain-containing protein [Aeriscardovia sp.]|nr:LPXTG cell wall anchor domain-containing protein [Aeriscardovia sp.]
MSKKRLLILPIVFLMVAIMGVSVFAGASPSVGFDVRDNNGNNVTSNFTGTDCSKIDLTKISGLQKKIDAVNDKVKVKDFKYVIGYDIKPVAGYAPSAKSYKVTFANNSIKSGNVGLVVHQKADGTYDIRVFKGTGALAYIDGIKEFSPFCLYYAKPSSSPQTGDYAPAYIAAIAVVLLSGGVFFAIRAKKATK